MLFGDPDPAVLIASLLAILVGLTFHEFSHAYVADQLGDHRPRALGRVSLNPMRHIDPLGALMLLIARFGWAKPVPINPSALRGGRQALAVVAAAGPLANVIVAVAFAVLFRLMAMLQFESIADGFVLEVIAQLVFINILLAIFNVIPIPPLDGFNVVLPFLPPRTAWTVQSYAPYGVIVLLLLVLVPGSPLRLLLQLANPITGLLIGV